MLDGFADFEVLVRETVFANAGPDLLYCFDVANDEDVGLSQAGPLLSQNKAFVLFETDIDNTRRAGPGVHSPRRAWGSLTIGILTKDLSDPIGMIRECERIGNWFADKTIGSVRFRQFQPLGNSPFMGFVTYDAVINFDFELKPTG